MLRILVVDDMPVIRSTLVRILSEKRALFGSVIEAKNGEEAVALARAHKPDIILMDIKMPHLTGLQATAIIRQEQPNTKIVILSAYNEFSYVQKALKLGARDYLLKPVRPKKLLQLLDEIQQEIEADRRDSRTVEMVKDSLQKALPMIEGNLVENLIRSTDPEESSVEETLAYLGKRLASPFVLVAKIDQLDQFLQGRSATEIQQMYGLLIEMLTAMVPEPQRTLVGYSNPGRIVAIISADNYLTTPAEARTLAEQIRQHIADNLHITVTIGLGKRYETLGSIPLSYAEANLARRYQSQLKGNRVIYIDDIQIDQSSIGDGSHYLVMKERELVQVLEENQQKQALPLLREIIDYLIRQYYDNLAALKNHCAELVMLAAWGVINGGADERQVLKTVHYQVNTLQSWNKVDEVRGWTENSLIEIMNLADDSTQQQDAVQSAVSYIHGNYQRSDISLQEIADVVNISQSHLSSQFKSKVGMSYVKYLTAIRMDEAKKLLRTTDQTISNIALITGYPNVTNFYRHFRRHTGMTPAVYRETKDN